jgi:hypothetical protein
MPVIDMHSHWATRRGYPLQSEAELAQQERTWRSRPNYRTEAEMAEDFRRAGVRVILDFGYSKYLAPELARPLHDYGFATIRAHSDVMLGQWVHFQAELGIPALAEFHRVLEIGTAGGGFVGLAVSGSGGLPASDPAWDPFYRLCIEAGAPALIFVGTTGLGAGLPGGMGITLDSYHPRHLDAVAARFADLTIIAARPAWPWQSEMIAILLHKPNVWCELHGWSPRYFTDELKREIPRRLAERVMFAADYPLFSYERLFADWRALGYDDAALERIFHGNATALLDRLGLGPA